MNYFQKDIETMPRAELEKLQLEKLKHITKYCYDNVPLYKKKFDEFKSSIEQTEQSVDSFNSFLEKVLNEE